MRNGTGFFGACDLNQSFGDERTRDAGAEKILAFVDRSRLDHGEDEVAREFLAQIFDETFRCTGLERFLFKPVEFLLLPNVRAKRNDFGLIIFLEPAENDRGVETTGIC